MKKFKTNLFLVLLLTLITIGCAKSVYLGEYKTDMMGNPEKFELFTETERQAKRIERRIERRVEEDVNRENSILLLTPDQIETNRNFLWHTSSLIPKKYQSQLPISDTIR